jgi:hypothetical protein
MANWADFQTALQFVAGLNVALWGVPELRAPSITNEKRKEASSKFRHVNRKVR